MKSYFKPVVLLLFATAFVFQSCKKDDSSSSSGSRVDEGVWKVSYYYDDKDETYKFNGYTFTFNSDGSVSAVHSSGSASGSWNISSSSNKFNLSFGAAAPLDDLTDDWLIQEQSGNLIRLKDDNTTRLEELHFNKM